MSQYLFHTRIAFQPAQNQPSGFPNILLLAWRFSKPPLYDMHSGLCEDAVWASRPRSKRVSSQPQIGPMLALAPSHNILSSLTFSGNRPLNSAPIKFRRHSDRLGRRANQRLGQAFPVTGSPMLLRRGNAASGFSRRRIRPRTVPPRGPKTPEPVACCDDRLHGARSWWPQAGGPRTVQKPRLAGAPFGGPLTSLSMPGIFASMRARSGRRTGRT